MHVYLIPHPSLTELIISGQVYVAIRVVVRIGKWLESTANKERKRIIKNHVWQKHPYPLRHCEDGDCASLGDQSASLAALPPD